MMECRFDGVCTLVCTGIFRKSCRRAYRPNPLKNKASCHLCTALYGKMKAHTYIILNKKFYGKLHLRAHARVMGICKNAVHTVQKTMNPLKNKALTMYAYLYAGLHGTHLPYTITSF